MFDNFLKWFLPFGMLSFGLAGEGGGNGGDKGKEGDKGDEGKVSKEDYDKVVAESGKLKQDLEDLRMEILTPEYLEFLGDKDKGKGKDGGKKPPATDDTISDDKFEKMSKKEIFEAAKTAATKEMEDKIEGYKKADKDASDAATAREIAAFARAHDDYSTYRPIMYGLSLDPKNKDMTLQELYDMAKGHVKRIHTEPSEEEKARQKKLKGEKPGGASKTFEELKMLSKEEAAKEALAEVKEKLGPIPPA